MPRRALASGGGTGDAYLVLGQQLAFPLAVRDVVDGEAEVVSAVLEVQRLWFVQQLPADLLLHLQHFLWRRPDRDKTSKAAPRANPWRSLPARSERGDKSRNAGFAASRLLQPYESSCI